MKEVKTRKEEQQVYNQLLLVPSFSSLVCVLHDKLPTKGGQQRDLKGKVVFEKESKQL